MKLAVLVRQNDPFSLCIYRENILQELTKCGVAVVSFADTASALPECDLIWEPGMVGSRPPHPIFKNCRTPMVSTVHGVGPFTTKWKEIYPSIFSALLGYREKKRTLAEWNWFRKKLSAVIAVSEYGAREISQVFALPKSMVHIIHHGVDHTIFQETGDHFAVERPYLFHASQYRPKKNVDRIFTAYARLPEHSRPGLLAVLPDYRNSKHHIDGITVIQKGVSQIELARFYRGAIGLVFPSLHETFGMPILEAMACGCPVITSNTTACPEVADDAALQVDPRSAGEISNAMRRLVEDHDLRKSLRQKGLDNARQFTWSKSAEKHLEIFNNVLSKKAENQIII